jgi:hypothetical protein
MIRITNQDIGKYTEIIFYILKDGLLVSFPEMTSAHPSRFALVSQKPDYPVSPIMKTYLPIQVDSYLWHSGIVPVILDLQGTPSEMLNRERIQVVLLSNLVEKQIIPEGYFGTSIGG